jgi:hypothetical protein
MGLIGRDGAAVSRRRRAVKEFDFFIYVRYLFFFSISEINFGSLVITQFSDTIERHEFSTGAGLCAEPQALRRGTRSR